MGFYFKKSKSVGPVRVNLSKSGVGVSTGVKGARMSFGPRGTYVNLGRNGIYYRKKIGGRKASQKNKSGFNNSPAVQPQLDYTQVDTSYEDVIRVADNANSDSILGQEIVKDINRSRLVFWLWLLASIALIYFLKEWGLLLMIVTVAFLGRFFSARLSFELDSEAELEWKKLTEIIYGMRDSKKLWLVETASYNANTKVHAGAYRNISRGDATVRLIKAKRGTGLRVKADVATALIKSKKCKILFIPSGILVKKGSKYVAYSYEQINLYASTTNFIEHGSIARDAEVVRRTWQYVNKNGTADKRYNNNKQLPVCLYGTLDIRGNNLDVELQTSNKTVTKNVGSAYQHYKNYVRRIGSSNTGIQISQVSPASVTSSNGNQFISYEERKILEEMNQTLRELGKNGYVEVLEEQLECRINFVDGQLYQQHALFLYSADKMVSDRLSSMEYMLNANTQYKNVIQPVSERDFLVHLYMDNLDSFKKELPLSRKLTDALEKASIWKSGYQVDKANQDINRDQTDIREILSSGADLFSGEIDSSSEYDAYEGLFEDETAGASKTEGSDGKQDAVDELLDFFDEE